MYSNSVWTLAFVGMNAFSFAQSLEPAERSKDATTASTGTEISFSFTVHTRHTTTASRTTTSSPPQVSTGQYYDEEENRCRDCVSNACQPPPSASGGQIDWSIPCWAANAIQMQCNFGPEALEWFKDASTNRNLDPHLTNQWVPQPPELARACLCSSRFAEMTLGCGICCEKHGSEPIVGFNHGLTANETVQNEIMKQYCDLDAEPTKESLGKAFENAVGSSPDASLRGAKSSAAASPSSSSSFSFYDPIGNATDVSLYFTPSVAGSSAYVVAMPTLSASDDGKRHTNAWFTYTSLPTSGGQIVPTADAASATDEDENAESVGGTTTAAAGAVQTAMAYSGLGIGAFGIVAAMAAAL